MAKRPRFRFVTPAILGAAVGAYMGLVLGATTQKGIQQSSDKMGDLFETNLVLTAESGAKLLANRIRHAQTSERRALIAEWTGQFLHSNNALSAVYVLVPSKAGFQVHAISGTSPGRNKGVVVKSSQDMLKAASTGISQSNLTPIRWMNQEVVRAYAPINAKNGSTLLLGVDYLYSKYGATMSGFEDDKRSGWAVAILLGLLTALGAYTAKFRQLKEEAAVTLAKAELEEINERLEMRVEQRTDELRQALEAKSMFLTSAGHELRTPLNGLMGMTTLALDHELPTELREYLTMAKESSIQLTQKVNQLLDLASLETNSLKLEFEEVVVGEEISKAADRHRVEAEAKGVGLSVTVESGLNGKFLMARRRLTQIVDNLVSNAVKYTDSGEVEVLAKLMLKDDGTTWLDLAVTDTGCGIEEHRVDSIFEHGNTDKRLPSHKTGLGVALAISRRICHLMGGIIEVEEDRRVGSHFRVVLPLPPAQVTQLA